VPGCPIPPSAIKPTSGHRRADAGENPCRWYGEPGRWSPRSVSLAFLPRALPPGKVLHHARRVLELCQENGIGDFDLAFAYEALARAHAVGGDAGQAREYTDRALAAAGDIADDEERDLVLADLETVPGQPRYW
jgi:hypothetical protein